MFRNGDTKNEGKALSKRFIYSSNSQQLIWNNTYAVFCLSFLNKDMISLQEVMSLIFSYLESLFNTVERLLSL